MRRAILLCVSLSAAGGCSNGFDPKNYVSSLRLLDVKAEPAEIPGGAMTKLTASWANPGKGTPTIAWDYCTLRPPPGSGNPTNVDCIQPDMGAPFIIPIGSGDSVTFTMPNIPLAQLGLPDSTDGFYVPIRLRLSDATQLVTAVFSLRYYPGAISPNPPNKNPTLMGLYRVPAFDAGVADQTEIIESMPPDVHNGDAIDLRALLTPDAQETYLTLSGDPTTGMVTTTKVTETVSVTWLATAGEFSDGGVTGQARPNITWTLDKNLPASGTSIDLWLVARDERGGSDIIHRAFNFK